MDENGVFVYCFWWILGLNLGREQLNGCMMYILLIVDYWYFMDLYGNWAARYTINRCRCSMTQMPHFPNPDVWEINAYIHECSILNMANNVWYTSFSSPWAPESLSQGLRKKQDWDYFSYVEKWKKCLWIFNTLWFFCLSAMKTDAG
jgi:hypothetical protein